MDDLSPHDASVHGLDLNLLTALNALLTERSVTRAAVSLHRSQPALSASLKRLRNQFRDDLLIRVGNGHELTPLAVQLKPRVAMVLSELERLFATRTRFDPSTCTREFVVRTTDYGAVMLGRAIADELAAAAPGATLRFLPLTDADLADPADALRLLDGFVVPHGVLDDLPHTDAYGDRWVLLVDGANRAVGDAVGLDELGRLEWVLPFHHRTSRVPAVRQLQLLGTPLRVAVSVDGFLALPAHLTGTERITVIQSRLATRIAPPPAFRVLECPFDAVPITEALWWHPTLELDPGHRWFRSLVERGGRRVATETVSRAIGTFRPHEGRPG
jgi:DNA-binding transcriptional LysR family regulator